MRPIITLTTDFGDGRYVAQLKGVLLALCPDAVHRRHLAPHSARRT